jgi:hypothetical protein
MNAEPSLRLQFIEGMLTNLCPLPLDVYDEGFAWV